MGCGPAGGVPGTAGGVRSPDHVRQARDRAVSPGPSSALPSVEEWMADVQAVLDAVGSEHAHVIANLGGGIMAMAFAAPIPGASRA